MPSAKKNAAPPGARCAFVDKLLLNQWLISLFGIDPLAKCLVDGEVVRPFHKLAEKLRKAPEGRDADGCHHFYKILRDEGFFASGHCALTRDELRRYEANIVAHTDAINDNEKRHAEPVRWKYFQWMALLFTEIYLDRYFRDRKQLLNDLNAYVARFNHAQAPGCEPIPPYTAEALNKVCLQNATGSGKTLLMHVNILQFKHYLKFYGREAELNYTYLLTPNESMSQQHLVELAKSRSQSDPWKGQLYRKDGKVGRNSIILLEISKLEETDGPKTVAVRSLGNNNLLLVDEGHSGLSGKDAKQKKNAWFTRRSMLCEKGFSFEYSATFGQAVSGTDHEDDYAKSILFDYSYSWFYADGYGKDYRIYNIPSPKTAKGAIDLWGADKNIQFSYLCGALLKFYQQLKLYLAPEKRAECREYNLEKPLWVFVGSSVSGGANSDDPTTDVLQVVGFFTEFLSAPERARSTLEALICKNGAATGLLGKDNDDFFYDAFGYLAKTYGVSTPSAPGTEQLYADILRDLFHAPAGGKLVLERVKGNSCEIALRVGISQEPFGLINVSDAKKLWDLLARQRSRQDAIEFADTSEYGKPLFDTIGDSASTVNLLIGAKKFVMGWNCWRVSTFGLMHFGQTEGAQIIQLFGRGVRLKGYGNSLKRSGYITTRTPPEYIEELETLNVFGIQADFMQRFRDYLAAEGLPGNERKHHELIPLKVTCDFGKKLKVLRPKIKKDDGTEYSFEKDGPVLQLGGDVPQYLTDNKIVLNWYLKVDSEPSVEVKAKVDAKSVQPDKQSIPAPVLALLDYRSLYFELEQFKRQKNWYNLNISVDGIRGLLKKQNWYELLIPQERLIPKNLADVQMIQRIAAELLKLYADKFYNYESRRFIEPRMEYRDLAADDPNFPDAENYHFIMDAGDAALIEAIKQLGAQLSAPEHDNKVIAAGAVEGINLSRHLFRPLFHIKAPGQITVMPVTLNDSEFKFVRDLAEYVGSHAGEEMSLLRNLSRGKGIGFFEASNFHPDFILWRLKDSKQYITFVEPHGLLHEKEHSDKIRFATRIKDIERRLGDEKVVLNSFILSWTKKADLLWRYDESDPDHRHILFMDDADYLEKLFAELSADPGGEHLPS